MPKIDPDYIETIHHFISHELAGVEGWLGNDAALFLFPTSRLAALYKALTISYDSVHFYIYLGS